MNISIKDVLQRIRPFFILYLIVLGACLIVKLLYTRETIYFTVNSWYSAIGDVVAPYITDIGEGLTVLIISAIIALFNYRAAFLMATSYAVTSLIAQLIKHVIKHPRPKLYFHDQLARIHFVKGMYVDVYNSFPSGHTVTAFSAGLVATYLCKNKAWGVVFLLVAMAVGYSRMYLSEHFFEDVMAGSAIGVFLTIFWLVWLDGKKFIHGPTWSRGLIRWRKA